MKRFLALGVALTAAGGVAQAQMAPNSELVRMDATLTQALLSGDHAAAMKMLDADFSWIDSDGMYYATTHEAFDHGVRPIVGVGSGVKVLEHKYNKVVYIERSQDEKKFSGHFWVQRPEGWKLLNINEVEVRERDYKTVPSYDLDICKC